MKVMKGATRVVVLMGSKAYKFPRFHSWRTFLNGLMANMTERDFTQLRHPLLAPVVFSLPAGFMVVMPRCQPILNPSLLEEWWGLAEQHTDIDLTKMVEYKLSSIGVLKGRLVAIDYG
jgi:hypothetical protein